ncbi:MAG: hypothetical protein HY459_00300 [Parcubacteria group bacterium]|nr:hypothetical protein [Parcubacteria group bacterium]
MEGDRVALGELADMIIAKHSKARPTNMVIPLLILSFWSPEATGIQSLFICFERVLDSSLRWNDIKI